MTARRVADRLELEFGKANVFIDVDRLDPGDVFPAQLRAELDAADVCVAIIGPNWAEAVDSAGRRRLEDPADYVRLEIRRSLERRIRVVPVLVDGASMPTKAQLPQDIDGLRLRQAIEIQSSTLSEDVNRLISALRPVTFFQLATPTFVTTLAGAALAMGIRTIGLPPLQTTSVPEQTIVSDPTREATVLFVAAVLMRTGIMAGICVAVKKAVGISTDRLLGTLGILTLVAAVTFGLEAYSRQTMIELTDSDTARVVRSFGLAAVYYGLAVPVLVTRMLWRREADVRVTAGIGLSVALAAGLMVTAANAADLAILRATGDVPFIRSLLIGMLEFPIRWGTIVAVILACLHRRTGLSIREEGGIVMRVLLFALGARLSSNMVTWISPEVSRWGVPLALSYAILVPPVLGHAVRVFGRTREAATQDSDAQVSVPPGRGSASGSASGSAT